LSVRPLSALARRRLDAGILVGAFLIVGTYLATVAPAHPPQTDEVATGQESATLVLHGHNPYGSDLAAAEKAAHLPLTLHTPTVTGGLISKISYPALSF